MLEFIVLAIKLLENKDSKQIHFKIFGAQVLLTVMLLTDSVLTGYQNSTQEVWSKSLSLIR